MSLFYLDNKLTVAQFNLIAGSGNSPWGVGDAESISRIFPGTNGGTSGRVWNTYFTAPSPSVISRMVLVTGSTAPVGITTARMGIYSCDAADNLTLVARTANDPTLGSSASFEYTRGLSVVGGFPASYTFIPGNRYAMSFIQVGTTCADITVQSVTANDTSQAVGRVLDGQTDLPLTIPTPTLNPNAIVLIGLR